MALIEGEFLVGRVLSAMRWMERGLVADRGRRAISGRLVREDR